MDFNYSEEQLGLQDSLQRFVTKDYGFEKRRALLTSDEGFSREAWKTYAELGILALPFPEDVGGLGGNAVDTMLVMQVLGAGLVLEPYVPTVILAGSLIRDFAAPAQREALLGPVAEGASLLALAHHEPGVRYAVQRVATKAEKKGAGYALSGHKAVVLGAASADQLLVSARTSGNERDADGVTLFLVDPKAKGVTLRPYRTQDGQRAADVVLDSVEVAADAMIGAEGAALPAIERALDYANAALCAEAVGIMRALNDATLEYLKTRKQFGVVIGSFQALKHRMADMTIAAEQASSMAILAAVKADSEDADERRRSVAGAKAYVMQQARLVGQQAVQLHGGIGVTDELIVSHWFKRLTTIGMTFGDVDHHLARYGELLQAA